MSEVFFVTASFLESAWQLDKTARKQVQSCIEKLNTSFRGHGLKIHKLEREKCDKRMRSARVNDDLRLIFLHVQNKAIPLYVDRHDSAYAWANGKYLRADYGALFLQDDYAIIHSMEEATPEIKADKKGLLASVGIRVKDLLKLGVDQEIADTLINISDQDKYLAFIMNVFPVEMQEILIDLSTGTKSLQEILLDFDRNHSTENDQEVNAALNHKDSCRRFYAVSDIEDLKNLLDDNMETWMLFLHPQQEKIVNKNYNGPSLIEGGPGTGKTVVAIHRAVSLAAEGKSVLLCTYSRKLANYLRVKVDRLMKQRKVNGSITVKGIDSLIYSLSKEMGHLSYRLDEDTIKALIKDIHEKNGPTLPLAFFQREYINVIQRFYIRSLDNYLQVKRFGSGQGLKPKERKKIWLFFNELLNQKDYHRVIDFEDLAYIVYQALSAGQLQPAYDSVVVDEAQDLSPWRLKVLTLLPKSKNNNLMIMSDSNQRIYQLSSWKDEVQINVVGRTHYLSLNYRTTKQIREYADRQFIRSQLTKDHIRDYKSVLIGPDPVVKEFDSHRAQYRYITESIDTLLKMNIKPHEIGVITPTKPERLLGVLDMCNISGTILNKDIYPQEGAGICLCTLHGCKGLEFRAVFLADCQEITQKLGRLDGCDYYEEIVQHQIECLKYVAVTRAREELFVTYVI